MEIPKITGLEIRHEIGRGSAGVVYEAETEDGSPRAVKIFDSISSNPSLIAAQLRRLIEEGAEKETVRVVAESLETNPAVLVMPLVLGEGGSPRNLQLDPQKVVDWSFIRKLARALSVLHRARVAHGNLKPGHVFLSDDGEPLLTDYGSGLMPGVHHYQFSDAILYAPPEQLRNPEGYLEEAGYRWDVYAFGVLSYRLLFGRFPRANEVFDSVCTSRGQNGSVDFEADHEGIARTLEQSDEIRWPDDEVDETEARLRGVLASCLHLNPSGRPFDMIEVSRSLEGIGESLARDEERRFAEARWQKTEKGKRRSRNLAAALSVLSIALGVAWWGTGELRQREAREASGQMEAFRDQSKQEIADLKEQLAGAIETRENAVSSMSVIQEKAGLQAAKSQLTLDSIWTVNDRLFDWILEGGDEELPVLESRKVRLAYFLSELDRQLEDLNGKPELAWQNALLQLRGAEIALAMKGFEDGERRLNQALAKAEMPDHLTARVRLRLLLNASGEGASILKIRLAEHEDKIRKGLVENGPGLLRAGALISGLKGQVYEEEGRVDEAYQAYLESLDQFSEMEALFPGNPQVTMGVGRRFLAAARLAEAGGLEAQALGFRAKALEAFERLASTHGKPSPELDYQMASARASQAISHWQQGDLFQAEKMARDNLEVFIGLEAKLPDDFRIVVDRVSQQGIIATTLDDGGRVEEARGLLQEGIRDLESGLEAEPMNGRARYLLASLKWQLSGILGQLDRKKEMLSMGQEARADLESILADKLIYPQPSEVRKSLAYLCGDLGHAAEQNNESEAARLHLLSCQRYWEELDQAEPDNPEVQNGLQWVLDRLGGLEGE